jgi:GT2 family glycosyltransferase
MHELTVIVPTYGHFDYALRTVESLFRCTEEHDVSCLLIDDASPEWADVDWSVWPYHERLYRYSYRDHEGPTRSWNHGLRVARDDSVFGAEYAVCANSDLLFTPGWYEPLRRALDEGWHLVGPTTNAPGHCPWQHIGRFIDYTTSDRQTTLASDAARLREASTFQVVRARINGFCMMAKTETWWSGAFDNERVFDPSRKLAGNEDELQERWLARNRAIGFVPTSYVFHYRSVSRPEGLSGEPGRGAFRSDELE